MEESIDRTTATAMPDTEVELYLEQLKTLHAIEQGQDLRNIGAVPTGTPSSMNVSSSSSTQRVADPVGGMGAPPGNNQNNNHNNNNNNGGGGNMPTSSNTGGGGTDIADVLAARLAALKR
jgi:hypothetical protein